MAADNLTPRSKNFSDWYNQLVLAAELADYAPVRVCVVVEPYGRALWGNLQLKRHILPGYTKSNAGH